MANIVVAIDLGTSRSTWALSMKGRAEEEIVIRIPEGSHSSATTGLKTETAILLSSKTGDFRAFGQAARKEFIVSMEDEEWELERGIEGSGTVPPWDTILFRCFKVALCRNQGYQSIHDPIAVADGGQSKPHLHVVSSTLKTIYWPI